MRGPKLRWALLALFIGLVGVAGMRVVYAQETGSNWTGYYWNNIDFTGNPQLTRTDAAINFNWKFDPPAPGFNGDNFSIRWYNTITFGGGTYRFRMGADDGIRVAIDGNLIYNRWSDATAGFQVNTVDVPLTAGPHQIIVDYYERGGEAGVLFEWTTISGTPSITATPITSAPVAAGPSTGNLAVSNIKAVVIVDLANVRTAPSTDSTPVAEVKFNTKLQVVANNGANTWFLVQLPDGRRGWIFRRMIYLYGGDITTLPVSAEAVQPPGGPQNVQGVARIQVLVRNLPSTRNSDKVGVINEGQYFQILKLSKNRAWVFVDAEGLRGWVFLPNVKVVFGLLGRVPVGNDAP